MDEEWTAKGYRVVPSVLDDGLLNKLRAAFDVEWCKALPRTLFSESGAFAMLDLSTEFVVDLLTWPRTLEVLVQLGIPRPRLHSFYVSTKPPGASELFWHSDLFYPWDKPTPAEIFAIYPLADTTPHNGCLRIVPGSHHRQDAQLDANLGPDHRRSNYRSDEINVPLQAGDLFVGDRRLLHATHANQGNTWRTCLTVSYVTALEELPPVARQLIFANPCLSEAHRHPKLKVILTPSSGGAPQSAQAAETSEAVTRGDFSSPDSIDARREPVLQAKFQQRQSSA